MGVNYDLDWYFGSDLVLIKDTKIEEPSRVRSDIEKRRRQKKVCGTMEIRLKLKGQEGFPKFSFVGFIFWVRIQSYF